MSTLNALAQKHGITVPLRVSDCPKVLTIVKIDNQMFPTARADARPPTCSPPKPRTARSTRCASTASPSANSSASSGRTPRSKASGCSPARSTSDGDKIYIAFAPPPAINTPKKPEFLPGAGEGTAPIKDKTQFALNPEAQAAIASLERTMKTM